VNLTGEYLSPYLKKVESASLRKRDDTVTNIYQSLPHIMAGKHVAYGTKKLRHCHPMYIQIQR